ncbi:hypothetical protein [Pseudomonas sp. H2_E05]
MSTPSCVNSVSTALGRHRLPANNLTLEITETTAMSGMPMQA